jgi:hypothetical protein
MKMKILKGEYLFSEQGTHICDENGFALIAEEDTECHILPEHLERVQALVIEDRVLRGLDAEGNPIPEEVEEAIEEASEETEEDTLIE